MFRSLRQTNARWRPFDGEGLEHLTIRPVETSAGAIIRAGGTIIGDRGGTPYGVSYRIDCSPHWEVLFFSVETTDGRTVALWSDGNGHWRHADGRPLPDFDGCIDIDLAGTPFTNSLPIRRLDLTPGSAAAKLNMLYIPFDTFEPTRDAQRYSCLKQDALYRYEAEERSFTADLPVDEDGLVLDYPGLFQRLAL
ncbi:putative glycolipid-binding domain-containing protein [Rhizobium tubonense]|uniref:Transcriptional regulator n=1 Tax=Rhizobium tubonense TaxID=484088 RepID=A0A2W4C188_9HYPH|nr:putative glycolipid-binding domain-containing protein [Rhizobium tubonense]PZM07649.1 transcriptional regulator [Rhizobium tubonense]